MATPLSIQFPPFTFEVLKIRFHFRYLSRTFPLTAPCLCVRRDGQNGCSHSECPPSSLGLQRDLESFLCTVLQKKVWDRPHRQLFSSWHICSGVNRELEVWCPLFFVNVMLKCWWLGFGSISQSKVPTGEDEKLNWELTTENWNHLGRWSFIFSYAATFPMF